MGVGGCSGGSTTSYKPQQAYCNCIHAAPKTRKKGEIYSHPVTTAKLCTLYSPPTPPPPPPPTHTTLPPSRSPPMWFSSISSLLSRPCHLGLLRIESSVSSSHDARSVLSSPFASARNPDAVISLKSSQSAHPPHPTSTTSQRRGDQHSTVMSLSALLSAGILLVACLLA